MRINSAGVVSQGDDHGDAYSDQTAILESARSILAAYEEVASLTLITLSIGVVVLRLTMHGRSS